MHRRTIALALITSLLAVPAAALQPAAPIARLAPDGDAITAAGLALSVAADIGALDAQNARAARAALQIAHADRPSAVVQAGLAIATARGAPAESDAFAQGAVRILDTLEGSRGAHSSDDVLALAQALAAQAPNAAAIEIAPYVRSLDLDEALARFLDAHAWANDEATRAQLAPLSSLPHDAQKGLAIMLDATTHARGAALAPREAEAYGHLAQVRAATIGAVREAAPLLAHVSGGPNLKLCGLLILDLEGVDDTHAEDCLAALSIDVAGNDLYLNNAGGATHICHMQTGACPTSGLPPAAIALDLRGDDRYEGAPLLTVDIFRGVETLPTRIVASTNGGAHGGVGHLIDLAGSDVYHLRNPPASHTVFGASGNGGARFGAGLLLDIGEGDDEYVHERGTFTAAGHAVATWGASLTLDAGGDDTYEARGSLQPEFAFAANGIALMVDLGGHDTYDCLRSDCLSEAHVGLALLADLGGGNDRYASGNGLGFAQVTGVAVALDDGGTNSFLSEGTYAQGVGWGGYPVANLYHYGGALGVLVTGEGADTFSAVDPWSSSLEFPAMSQGAGMLSGVGILADLGGTNAYTSNTALAQGSGLEFGDGILLDRGTAPSLVLGAGSAGQGSGIQGVGLILQTRGDALTNYVASAGSLPSLTLGGGLGARVNRGDFALVGAFPDLLCPPEAIEVIGFENATVYNERLLTLRLCTPDEETEEALRNPATGEPVGDVPRPAIPCRELAPCSEIVGGELGEGPVDWLESPRMTTTFSGGLTWISGTNGLLTRYMTPSADDLCKLSCAGFNAVDRVG